MELGSKQANRERTAPRRERPKATNSRRYSRRTRSRRAGTGRDRNTTIFFFLDGACRNCPSVKIRGAFRAGGPGVRGKSYCTTHYARLTQEQLGDETGQSIGVKSCASTQHLPV